MCQERSDQIWTTEAGELKNGLAVARAIMPPRLDRAPVLVLNGSDAPKTVIAGTILSELSIAEYMEPEEEGIRGGNLDARTYNHLEKLTDRMYEGVDNEQMRPLKRTLKGSSLVASSVCHPLPEHSNRGSG